MLSRRGSIVLSLLGMGLLGLVFTGLAQEGQPPWPPPPIRPPPIEAAPSSGSIRPIEEPSVSVPSLPPADPVEPTAPPKDTEPTPGPLPAIPTVPLDAVGPKIIEVPDSGATKPGLLPATTGDPPSAPPIPHDTKKVEPSLPKGPGMDSGPPPVFPPSSEPSTPRVLPKGPPETPVIEIHDTPPKPAPVPASPAAPPREVRPPQTRPVEVPQPESSKKPPRFTFGPSPARPDEPPPALTSPEPPRPPSFRIVIPSRRQAPAMPQLVTEGGLRPGAFLTGGASAVVVEKRGPATAIVGQAIRYDIIVRNNGTAAAQRVRVEDEIPASARLIAGAPAPYVQGNRAIWVIDSLPPGQEMLFQVEVQPGAAGEFVTSASVILSSSSVRTMVSAPVQVSPMSLQITGPAQTVVGQAADFDIRLTNTGSQPVAGLTLRVRLSAGLGHPEGKDIQADLTHIGAGETKTIQLTLQAIGPGRHTLDAVVFQGTAVQASMQGAVQIMSAGLSLRQLGTTQLVLDRQEELKIELANYQNEPKRNVVVTETLPPGVEFLAASDRGIYRPETRTVHWTVDLVPAGQTRLLTVKVQGRMAGERVHQATARTGEGEEIQAEAVVQVSGVAALAQFPGDRRFRVQLTSELLSQPLVREERTVVYQDR